jgi:uncharacterized protein YjbI with pentapeptide repeats
MRVLKQQDQSFLAGVFGLRGKLFFSASALLFFDLADPAAPLPEGDLWKLVKARVAPPTPFDAGLPKPRAEVLVHGACHPRPGRPLEAGRVRLKLGDVDKTLFVFGPRHWEQTATGWTIVHDPVPAPPPGGPAAQPLPLAWEHAFGGPDFPDNPVGLGHAPLPVGPAGPDGQGGLVRPLPRIEDPAVLIGSPTDTPRPAGFAPLDQTRPQRLARAGTYGGDWLKDRWPLAPDDFDLHFHNTAPEDQWLPGYLRGDEALALEGMHPEKGLIESRLPGLKVRCFLTLMDDPHGDPKDLSKARFLELKTNLDTVWLFPGDLRGALCFRGACEIRDDEMRDVLDVLLVTEPLGAPDHPLEYFRDLRDTWVDRVMNLDQEQIAESRKEIAETLEHFRGLPERIREDLDKGLGKTPTLPVTPAEQFAGARERLGQFDALLDRMEPMARGMKKEHGHLVPIDLGIFGRLRQTLADQRVALAENQERFESAMQQAEAARDQAVAQAKARMAALKARGVAVPGDPDDFVLGPKEDRWPRSAMRQLAVWRKEFLGDQALGDQLRDWGLTDRTMERHLLGSNPAPATLSRKAWGLDPGQDGSDEFTVPAGLVLPLFQEAAPLALLVRTALPPGPPHPAPEADVPVPGSKGPDEAGLALGATPERPLVLAADFLDALLLSQELKGLAGVVLCPAPGAPLPPEAAAALDAAPALVAAISAPDEATATALWEAWKKARPGVLRLPLRLPQHWLGPLEAKRRGEDLRALLRDILPRELAEALPKERPPIRPEDVKPGMPLEIPDVGALIKENQEYARSVIQTKAAPLLAMAQARKAEALAKAEDVLKARGLDPAKYLTPPPKMNAFDIPAVIQEVEGGVAKAKDALLATGRATPEQIAEVEQAGARGLALLQKAAGVVNPDGSINPPQWAKDLRAKFGLDPDTGKGLDREAVEALLARGQRDFSGRDLSGADLSGLDFSGADLSGAVCIGTDFSGCDLTSAVLARAFCKEADFSGARMSGADLSACLLAQARLAQARLDGARCEAALFAEAECGGADFTRADLGRCLFDKAGLEGANLSGIKTPRATFKEARLAGAGFAQSDLSDAIFIGCDLAGLDLSGLPLRRAAFLECRGEGAGFEGADMERARFLQGCDLPGARFAGARLAKASFSGGKFPGADFTRAELDKALVQECDLTRSHFTGASAREARFTRCNLERAGMRGVNLLHGSLRKARLVEADLSRANLHGVDFFKAELGNTNLQGSDTARTLLEKRLDLLREGSLRDPDSGSQRRGG